LKAVILAGGYATRLRPLSCSNPKLLFPVVGVPLIDLMVRWLKQAGIDDVILAVNHLSDKLRTEIGAKRLGSKITFSIEENPLGTAGPIRLAKNFLGDEPFVVINGDIVSDVNLKQMIRSHEENNAKATVSLVTVPDARQYGAAELNQAGRITKFEEKSAQRKSQTVNAGVYVLDPSIIHLIPPARPSSMESMIFPRLASEGSIWGQKHAGYWYDIGTIPNYLKANKELLVRFHNTSPSKLAQHERPGQSKPAAFMGDRVAFQLLERQSGPGIPVNGVSITQPCFIGEASTLRPGASIGPSTILARGVNVDHGSKVRDSIIFEYTSIAGDCHIDGAIIGERVSIGSGTKIGPGAIIAGEVNIPSNSIIKQKAIVLN